METSNPEAVFRATPPKFMRGFALSAGALLLAIGCALFLSNRIGGDIVQHRDPVFMLSTATLFWVASGVAVVLALYCLFGERIERPIGLVAWVTTTFALYRLGLVWMGAPKYAGYLGGFPKAFGVPQESAVAIVEVVMACLLVGSYVALLSYWIAGNKRATPKQGGRLLKISCVYCGGHFAFSDEATGRTMPCPHCSKTITLKTS